MPTIANSNAATQAEIRDLTSYSANIDAKAYGVIEGAGNEAANDIALIAMRDFMLASPDTLHHIYFEPGDYVYTNNRWLLNVKNFILDAYGCTFQCTIDNVWDGNSSPLNMRNIFDDAGDTAVTSPAVYAYGDLFNTVAAGQDTITTTTAGDAADYATGERVILYGYDQQFGGFPPNLRYFEYKTVLSIDTGTVTFTEPLRFSYNDEWTDKLKTGSYGNVEVGAPRVLSLDRTDYIWGNYQHFRGCAFLPNPTRPTNSSIQPTGKKVIFEDLTTQRLPIAMCEDVFVIRCKINPILDPASGVDLDKLVTRCSLTDCEISVPTTYNAIGGGTSFHQLTLNRCRIRGNIKANPRSWIIDDCWVVSDDAAQYGMLSPEGNWPIDVLKVSGTTFVNTSPGVLLYAINTLPQTSLTVDSVTGTNIELAWDTAAENAAKALCIGKALKASDETDCGVVTDIYWDGGSPGNLIVEGTWASPGASDVYEFDVINEIIDGGGNNVVGTQVDIWRYPYSVKRLGYAPINSQSGTTYRVVLKDAGTLVTMTNASANTATIPANATLSFPIGTEIHFAQYGTGATTIALDSDTLRVEASLTAVLNGRWAVATAKKIASTEWFLFGNLEGA